MAKKPVKPPKQLFVTFDIRKDDYDFVSHTYTSQYKIGYVSVYAPQLAKWQSTLDNQIKWCADGEYMQQIVHSSSSKLPSWVYFSEARQVGDTWFAVYARLGNHFDIEIPVEITPVIYDNVPQVGLKLVESVHRLRGNKLIRVEDPRGFQFELAIDAFMDLVPHITIRNGVIETPLMWKTAKLLMVAPEEV